MIETAFVGPDEVAYNAVRRREFNATKEDRSANQRGRFHVLTVRPKVAELSFQLYGRSLHPELFTVFQSRSISRGGYEARIDITSAGHLITWRYQGLTLTEVADRKSVV